MYTGRAFYILTASKLSVPDINLSVAAQEALQSLLGKSR
ncbi:hypothetical protein M2273_000446 [Mucilaginibacter lappiensis]|jgi:hypothetical protein